MNGKMEEEDFATRRAHLTAQIARQRGELVAAYQNLEKPIHYAEYGMRGFGFVRNNPWIFMVLPTSVTVVSSLINLFASRKKGTKQVAPAQAATAGTQPKVAPPSRAMSSASQWLGYVAQGVQLYRQIRRFFLL